MSSDDARVVAQLMLLHRQINPIIDEIQAGDLDPSERRALAEVLCTIAAELDPGILRARQATAERIQRYAEQLRPAGPLSALVPRTFSANGPGPLSDIGP